MDPDRWLTVKRIFQEALDRPAEGRAAFVREACRGDDELRQTVEAMLARESSAAGFLESPALGVEARAIAREIESSQAAPPPAIPTPVVGLPSSGAHPYTEPLQRRAPAARAPWWMWILAALFVADVLIRTWCYAAGPEGLGFSRRAEGARLVVTAVADGFVAARAGVRPGDVIVAIDGQPAERFINPRVIGPNLEVGRVYRFDVERGGRHQELSARMGRLSAHVDRDYRVVLLWQAASLVMLATGLLIAFKRPRDRVARLGALTLAALAVGMWLHNIPPGYAAVWRNLPLGLGALLTIPNLAIALVGAIGLTFFVEFPRPLFRSRWPLSLVWLPALLLLPVYIGDTYLIVYHPAGAYGRLSPSWIRPYQAGAFGLYGLAMLAAITANYLRLADASEKRRLRVMLVGGAAGTLPALARVFVGGVARESAARAFLMTGWPDPFIALVFLLFPISFAYAVLRHRLLGVRVIVRLGVQYALAKGLVISLVPALGLVLAADALVHSDHPLIEILRQRGAVYGVLAALAVLVHSLRRRVSLGIDRRFFREHYDASRLLRDVAGQARRAGSLERAGPAVVSRIEAALQAEFAALLFRPSGEAVFRCLAAAPAGQAPPGVGADDPLVARLRAADRPLVIADPDAANSDRDDAGDDTDGQHRLRPQLLVPIVLDPGGHEALLAFGAKKSQEPFTREDLDSLEGIASSLALLLEGPTPAPDRLSSVFEECPRCGSCYDSGAALCAHEQARLIPVAMPRTLAGRYRLEQRLGHGGMGKVYAAVDVALDRRVAVKVIRDEWVHSAAAVARFRREARLVAGFAHPNVVTVYDYGVETGARAFLVMELLGGVTLRDELRRGGRLDAARTLALMRGVCSAVEAAHHHHLVHRDLKPENVFLVDRAAGGTPERAGVKVLDFGVAKPLPDSEASAGADDGAAETELGVLVGTVGYLSPEQLLGERPQVSWDLWALAVVTYEALTGSLPFPVVSRDLWRQAVLAGRYTPLAEHLPVPPARWQEFFARVLSVDRAARPASAEEFLRELESALA